MREVEFKMERPGLVEIGEHVNISEYHSPGGYSYIIEPSLAMSTIYKWQDRLFSKEGIVTRIDQSDRGFHVFVQFEEEKGSGHK